MSKVHIRAGDYAKAAQSYHEAWKRQREERVEAVKRRAHEKWISIPWMFRWLCDKEPSDTEAIVAQMQGWRTAETAEDIAKTGNLNPDLVMIVDTPSLLAIERHAKAFNIQT